MWFEYAQNRVLIETKLGGILPLDNLEFIRILFDNEGVLFCFGARIEPTSNHEYAQDGFNSILFNIKMLDVKHFKYKGSKGIVITSPTIKAQNQHSIIEIEHPCLNLKCIANTLRIESIDAYIDDRWD